MLHPHPSVGAIYAEIMRAHQLNASADALDAAFHHAFHQAHQAPRRGISEETEKEWWRTVVRQTLEGLAVPADFEALFEDLWGAFAEPRRWRLYDGAIETLRELKSRGYRLALLSNWDRRLRPLVKGVGLAPFFEHLIISSEVGAEKPDPRIFRMAEAQLGLPPERFLHVGDSVHHDVEGARKAGWRCILVSRHADMKQDDGWVASLGGLLAKLPAI